MELEQEPSYVDHGLRRLFWWSYIAVVTVASASFAAYVKWGSAL